MVLIKWYHTLFIKECISCIVSYNSSQTLRFEHLIIILNSYQLQIWTQPYAYHNIWKYEVTLLIVMQKTYFFYSLLRWHKRHMQEIQEIPINIQKNIIKWKILILEKSRKKNHPSWSSYDREILYTSFNSRLKRKR